MNQKASPALFVTYDKTMITYRRATKEDVPAIVNLMNKYLSQRNAYELEALFAEKGVGFVAYDKDILVGVGTALITDDAGSVLALGQNHLVKELKLKAPIGVMKTAAVEKEYRSHGVGAHLTALRKKWMDEQGINSGYSSAWIYPSGKIPAQTQLINNGFERKLTVKGYWGSADYLLRRNLP